ncbi:MAG: AAA family ATPase [Ignavibacteria bacterium]|nr:AAA family ATPase [Ignavibacteria bacterium]
MFKSYYGLKFNPFDKAIDITSIYESHDIKELGARFKYLQSTRGIFLLTGEPGTGKSTALRRFATSLNPSLYKVCYFPLSTVTVMDFYRGLLFELGEIPSCKKVTMFKQIQESILSLYHEQKITPVIILDEVQMLSNSILEELRLVFNFKMDSENPYILILSGQSTLRNKLQLSINTPLRQRISIKHSMQGLKKEELNEYISSLLKAAGNTNDIFTPQAIEVIYSLSKGVPRIINNIATASLMYGCATKKDYIDEEAVYQGQKDFEL